MASEEFDAGSARVADLRRMGERIFLMHFAIGSLSS